MLRKIINIFPYFLLLLIVLLACTKEVDTVTEVEFELLEEHQGEGYVNETLPTTLTVVPEAMLEGYEYSFSYKLTNGEGHLENSEGEIFPIGEKIPFNPLSATLMFKGMNEGNHSLQVMAEDNFGFSEEIEITYAITNVPVTWTATSTVSEIEFGKSGAILITLGIDEENTDVTYEYNITVTENAVQPDEALEEYTPITSDTYELALTPQELGTFTVNFNLRDSNGQELTVPISFEVVADVIDTAAPEINLVGDNPFEIFLGLTYSDPGATAIDDIDGDISENIVIDTTAVNTLQEGSFEVTFSVSDDDENSTNTVRTVNVVRDPNGNQAPVAVNDTASTEINQGISIMVLQNDTDADTEIAELLITDVGTVEPSESGTVEFVGQTITFTPANGFEGNATFLYTIHDGNIWNEASAQVNVSVVDSTIKPTGISVTPETAEIVVGSTLQLQENISPIEATNQQVIWSSDNPTVATIDPNGLLTAIEVGRVKITATSAVDESLTALADIGVNPATVPVSDIHVNPNTISLFPGDTGDLTSVILPENASNQGVEWSSSEEGIATVDGNGKVTAVAVGTAIITATSLADNTINDLSVVTVDDGFVSATDVVVDPEVVSLEVGNLQTLSATVLPDTAFNKNVVWSSNNVTVATVDQNGQVTALLAGTATITATSENNALLVDTCEVTVTGPDTQEDTTPPVINLNGGDVNLNVGEPYEEQRATATDNIDGDLSASIAINNSAVNTNSPGIYQVTYNVSDAAGNPADQVVRTVTVGNPPDTVPPVINLVGGAVSITVGQAYTEPGATANDNVDGDLTSNIVRDESSVDTATAGTYQVTYDVLDEAGNPAEQVIRTVTVTDPGPTDTNPPVITLNGGDITLNVGEGYGELGATAFDEEDGPLSNDAIVIDNSAVNTSVAGVYEVTYDVEDAARNRAEQVIRTVTVTDNRSAENDITAFVYPNQSTNAVIDDVNHTITIPVFSGADRTVAPQDVQVSNGATINPLGTIGRDFTVPVTYTVTAENEDQQLWTVTITEDENNSHEITKFTINGVDGDIIGTDIELTLPPGTNLNALIPTIEFIGRSIFPASGQQQNFTNPIEYLVTAENDAVATYRITVTTAPQQPSFTFTVLGPGGEVNPGQPSDITFNIQPNQAAIDQNIRFSMSYSVTITRQTEFTYGGSVNIAGSQFTVTSGSSTGTFVGNVPPCEPVSVTFTVTNSLGLPSQSETVLINYGSGGNPCP